MQPGWLESGRFCFALFCFHKQSAFYGSLEIEAGSASPFLC